MNNVNLRQWLAMSALFVLPAFFQNCGSGGSLHLEDIAVNEASSLDAFFDYPYSSQPDHFTNVQVVTDPGQPKLASFTAFAAIAPVTGSDPVSYTLQIMDGARNPICPALTGTLPPETRSFSQDCVPAAAPSALIVELTFTPAGQPARTLTWNY